ncbi:MAG: hypothetical protein HRT57_04540 [Crocinitomicaceae bacterium]|nr:hypothetical protein [Crocinitomicaceae bacterium]
MKVVLLLAAILRISTAWSQIDSLETPIFDFPDLEASFPNEPRDLQIWIIENIHYPDKALENDEITNIKIERSVSPLIDAEVMHIMKLMPQWIPAEAEGKLVRSKVRLPFSFCI